MPDVMRLRLLALVVPLGLFGIGTVLLAGFTVGTNVALSLALSSCALLLVVCLWEWLHALRLATDLEQLRCELDVQLASPDLPDLSVLRPVTKLGKALAAHLQAILMAAQEAAHNEEIVRRDIETAQNLRVGFVASMGHDLRGPLASMLGFADLLLMDDDDSALQQRASLQTIRQRTLDLLTLIDEMLDWAKLEAGRMTLVRTPIPANDILKAIQQLAEARSAGRGLHLNIEITDWLPKVAADMRHLPRAVVAVMGDAIRSESTTPVKLSARTNERGDLLISLHDPTLLIRDEDQARFFEAFRPSYAPSGKRIAGLGLGAACAKAIFSAHGGDVSFTSSPSDGTRFYMTLPSCSANELS